MGAQSSHEQAQIEFLKATEELDYSGKQLKSLKDPKLEKELPFLVSLRALKLTNNELTSLAGIEKLKTSPLEEIDLRLVIR